MTDAIYNLTGVRLEHCNLVYRATRDGFSAKDFHLKCDGMPNTLTIIKSTAGNIFGGFTKKPWNSTDKWVDDKYAYIFSLINNDEIPFKRVNSYLGKRAIFCDSSLGPCFGSDIIISSDSNTNQTSYSNFGDSFKHKNYPAESEKAKNILAGSHKFQTIEIEVYFVN